MNTLFNLIPFQPVLPGGGGSDTGIDNVPIDNYVIGGMVVAILLSVYIFKKVYYSVKKA